MLEFRNFYVFETLTSCLIMVSCSFTNWKHYHLRWVCFLFSQSGFRSLNLGRFGI